VQRHQIVLVAASLILPACRAGRTVEYSVAVDPAFTADQVDAIAVAMDDWKTSVHELRVTMTIARCDSPSPQQVCIRPVHAPPDPVDDVVGTTRPGVSDSATVWIYVDRIQASGSDVRALTEQTAAHELGHAMGLKHAGTGTLMATYVPQQAQAVTAADVAQFWSVGGN